MYAKLSKPVKSFYSTAKKAFLLYHLSLSSCLAGISVNTEPVISLVVSKCLFTRKAALGRFSY